MRADVALVFDYPSWWGSELDSHPTQDLRYTDAVIAWYRQLWQRGVTVDVVPAGADLSGYRVVVVPTLYTVTDAAAERVAAAAAAARPSWSRTSAESSTRTTTCASAATPGRSASCSACAPRSSTRSRRASA